MEKKLQVLPKSYKDDINKAIKILKSYGATEIYIFGSIANGNFHNKSDIDIAIRGIKFSNFYKVASILMFELENEFDLVDLDDENDRFSQMIYEKGELLKVG